MGSQRIGYAKRSGKQSPAAGPSRFRRAATSPPRSARAGCFSCDEDHSAAGIGCDQLVDMTAGAFPALFLSQ